jgi:hypothetical protein
VLLPAERRGFFLSASRRFLPAAAIDLERQGCGFFTAQILDQIDKTCSKTMENDRTLERVRFAKNTICSGAK